MKSLRLAAWLCALAGCAFRDVIAQDPPRDTAGGDSGCFSATRCGGQCVDIASEPLHCGGCGRACAVPDNAARATCVAGACGVVCRADFVVRDGACVPPYRARPVAPLSTALVTSRRPTFRWALADGADGGRVEVCRDRACKALVQAFDTTGTSGAPTVDLPAGVLFWRLRGRAGGVTDDAVSPTWQFRVGARTAPHDASWGTTIDVNGDGFADVVVTAKLVEGGAGRAYVYLGSAAGLATTPATTLDAPDGAGGQFGVSMASAGDVNGDGFADVIVGAWQAHGITGEAYVYLGSAAGLAATPATTLSRPATTSGLFGASVASAGDVNGDGFADVVVGTTDGTVGAGSAQVFLGSAAGLATTPATVLASADVPGAHFGASVGSAGDINGDGFADVIVGAPHLGGQAANTAGRARVFLGSAGGVSAVPVATLTGPDGPNGHFGMSVAGAGDINGDGLADFVIGSWNQSASGHAYVYLGDPTGFANTPVTLIAPDATGVNGFGMPGTTAGDVNSDGFADVVIGAPFVANGTGAVYVFLGGAAGLGATPATTLVGLDGPDGEFGDPVASAGDFDGDGFADIVVGVGAAQNRAGRAYCYRGIAGGVATTPAAVLDGPDGRGGMFGTSVASPGGSRRRGRRWHAHRDPTARHLKRSAHSVRL